MKWAFVDYENVGCLSKLDLSVYDKVIVFVGAKQNKIDLGNKKYNSPINLVLIQIKEVKANNLDFHLSYYLGKYTKEAAPNVSFEVITNDNGFTPLIAHIEGEGRSCKQIRTVQTEQTEQIVQTVKKSKKAKKIKNLEGVSKLIDSLKTRPKEKRPQKVASLKNYIASHVRIKENEADIQDYLNHLVKARILKVSDNTVKYK